MVGGAQVGFGGGPGGPKGGGDQLGGSDDSDVEAWRLGGVNHSGGCQTGSLSRGSGSGVVNGGLHDGPATADFGPLSSRTAPGVQRAARGAG